MKKLKLLAKRGAGTLSAETLKTGGIKILLVVALLLSYFTPLLPFLKEAKADPFYPDGNNSNCQFSSFTAVQFNSLGGGGVRWNNSDLCGESGSWIQSHRFTDVGTPYAPSARRYTGVADRVCVPPNTQVDVGFYAWNYSGHWVNVNSVHLFNSWSGGDVGRLGAGGSFGQTCWNINGSPYCRSGRRVVTGGIGGYANRGNETGRIIHSFNMIQPITATGFSATPEWSGANLRIRYRLTLRNNSSYNPVCNIRVRDVMPSGQVYDQTHCINAGQTRTISYTENWGTSYPMTIVNNGATIWDNNRYTETSAGAMSSIFDQSPETRTSVAFRDDAGAPGWNGGQASWGEVGGQLYTVELIPYNFDSSGSTVRLQQNVSISKRVSDSDESQVTRNTASIGEEITYHVRVTNNEARVQNMRVVDDYNQNLITILNTGGGTDNGNTIAWTATLEHGESRTFNVRARVNHLEVGDYEIVNSARTQSPSSGPAVVRTDVRPRPNNEIEKYVLNLTAMSEGRGNSGEGVDHPEYGADADSWYANNSDVITIAGDEIQYTIVYRNTGEVDSPQTFVADHLPRYILDENGNQYEIIKAEDFVSVDEDILPVETPSGWDIVWDIGTLPVSNKWQTRQFVVRINPSEEVTFSLEDTQRLIANVSEIYSNNDLVERDQDNALVRVDQPIAEIVKGADKVIYQSNEEVIYTIEVSNVGSHTATGVVKDTIPAGMHFISSLPEADRVNGQIVEWDVTLGAGESVELQITAGFDVPVEDQAFFNNNVVYDYTDLNENERPDVEAEVEVQVLAPVFELEKIAIEPDIVTPTAIITYEVTGKNVGSGDAFDVVVEDSISAKLEVLPDSISHNGVYDPDARTITWDIGDVAAGEEFTRTFKARIIFSEEVNDGDKIENQAKLDSLTSATVWSEVVSSEITCGYLEGIVWEDSNKNAVIDEGELRIPNADIEVTVEDFEKFPITFRTDENGHYVATCVPYEKNLFADIVRPEGYAGQTTVDDYKVKLSQADTPAVYKIEENGSEVYVHAGQGFSHADLGLYRNYASGSVLAATGGMNLANNMVVAALLTLLSSLLHILKRKDLNVADN